MHDAEFAFRVVKFIYIVIYFICIYVSTELRRKIVFYTDIIKTHPSSLVLHPILPDKHTLQDHFHEVNPYIPL